MKLPKFVTVRIDFHINEREYLNYPEEYDKAIDEASNVLLAFAQSPLWRGDEEKRIRSQHIKRGNTYIVTPWHFNVEQSFEYTGNQTKEEIYGKILESIEDYKETAKASIKTQMSECMLHLLDIASVEIDFNE